MKIKLLLLVVVLSITSSASAQDPVFTQYFLVPQTLNPGFTGILEDWHAGIIHRTQWPNGQRQIDTDFAFINTPVGLNSGIGITLLSNREKFTNYNLTQVNATYSYKVELNEDWYFRPGLEVGFGRKDFNFGGLILEDQINRNTGAIRDQSIDPSLRNQNINFVDFNAGMLFNTEDQWIGATIKHLNKPDISFTGERNLPLEMFFSLHGGWEFDIYGIRSSFLPEGSRMLMTFNYMQQGEYNRLDAGTAMIFKDWTIGATIASNPFRKATNSHFVTSVNPFVSLQMQHFIFGLSYDANTSNVGQTRGVFELALTYQVNLHLKCWGCPNYQVK